MAAKDEDAGTAKVQFDGAALDALRTIVADWANERIITPPLPAAISSVIE